MVNFGILPNLSAEVSECPGTLCFGSSKCLEAEQVCDGVRDCLIWEDEYGGDSDSDGSLVDSKLCITRSSHFFSKCW